MPEVTKFKVIGYMVKRSRVDGAEYVMLSDFDRVTVERDALQQRLTAADERAENLRSALISAKADKEAYAQNAIGLRKRVDALQALLTAADERWEELVSAVRSINRSPQYKIMVIDDDEPQYRQRKEWIDWVLGLCDSPLKPAEGGGDE